MNVNINYAVLSFVNTCVFSLVIILLLTGWGLGPARFLKCTLRVFVVADLKIRIWPEFKSRYSRGVMNNLRI